MGRQLKKLPPPPVVGAERPGIKLTSILIEGFVRTFLFDRFDSPKVTPRFHKELWEMCCTKNPYVAIAAPRGHAKSSAGTLAYTLASICFGVSDVVLVISATEKQAIDHVQEIKIQLEENEDLIEAFKIHGLSKDNEAELVCHIGDRICKITAKGAGQKLRGAKWRNKRPNLIICHAKGTPIYDHALKEWIKAEDHPTAKEVEADCLRIKVLFEDDDDITCYDEVVSTEHFYLARETETSSPRWIQAKDLKPGYLIGDCDDKEIGRLLPRNAGIEGRAIQEEEIPGVQRNIPGTQQTGDTRATEEMGGRKCREGLPGEKGMDRSKSGEGQAIETEALREERRILSGPVTGILAGSQRGEENSCPNEEGFIKASHSNLGKSFGDQELLPNGGRDRPVSGSHSPHKLANSVRTSLHGESTTTHNGGELKKAQQSLAGYAGFVWRPVISKGDAGKGIVVMVRTKSGFYKTKFGMSHNCDDL